MSKLAVLMIRGVHFYPNYATGQNNGFQRDKQKEKTARFFSMFQNIEHHTKVSLSS